MHFTKTSLASGLLFASNVLAIDLDVNDAGSIRDAAKTIASSIVDRYHNSSDIPGLFGNPYYFWEGGLAWDSLINYWYQTGDDSYNDIVSEALHFQLGENNDYLPANQTKSEGNDDQTFWALAAMTAAEYSFPSEVLSDLNTTWADIAINIFNSQAARWDDETCNGGLRWQIFSFNSGYDYKNSASNGNFYQLASRLTRFTGNSTYENWSSRVLEWSLASGLISEDFAVYDGFGTTTNCSDVNHIQWSAYAGSYLAGASYAYNAVSPTPALPPIKPTILTHLPDPNPQHPTLPPPPDKHKLHFRLRHPQRHLQRHPNRNRLRALQKLQRRPTLLPRNPRPRIGPNPRPNLHPTNINLHRPGKRH
jgi:mannan endo-1,6-alpha-mannosidase